MESGHEHSKRASTQQQADLELLLKAAAGNDGMSSQTQCTVIILVAESGAPGVLRLAPV